MLLYGKGKGADQLVGSFFFVYDNKYLFCLRKVNVTEHIQIDLLSFVTQLFFSGRIGSKAIWKIYE